MSYRDKFGNLEELLNIVKSAISDGIDKDKVMTIVNGLILNNTEYKYGHDYPYDIPTLEIYDIVGDSDFDSVELATMITDYASLIEVLEELSSLSCSELIAARYRIARFSKQEEYEDD